jgi:hypothetical protein
MKINLQKKQDGGWILSYETSKGEDGIIDAQLEFFKDQMGFCAFDSDEKVLVALRLWAALSTQLHGRPPIVTSSNSRPGLFHELIKEGVAIDSRSEEGRRLLMEEHQNE